MFDLKGKKLLYLGGIKRACAIVKRAQELGVYVIVADYNVDSPAKKIADEAVLIDALDVDALVDYCIKNKVDGVTTAYVDILLPVCLEVGKRIGKPFYASDLLIEMSTNKEFFKNVFRKYDLPVAKTYKVTPESIDKTNIEYPIFVKPLDGSGSKGANVCWNKDDFIYNYKIAKSFSKCGEVLVEEYLIGNDIGADFLIVDGKAYFLSMWDRKFCKDRPVAVNHANIQILPSKKINIMLSGLARKIEYAFEDLEIENGIVFLQGYESNGKIKFFELGGRLGGTWPYIDEYFNNINPIDLLISHSLTGRMCSDEKICVDPNFNGCAAVVNFIGDKKSGTIKTVKGIDEVKSWKNTVYCIQYYEIGEKYSIEKQTDVNFVSLRLVADNMNELKKLIQKAYETIIIEDEDGSVFAQKYDVNEL